MSYDERKKFSSQQEAGKLPLFVTVYEQLYESIISGEYKPGEQLPSENDLAKQMGVSRGTLRQALLFLQEDSMIANRQGKGNFVLEFTENHLRGMETLNHPLLSHGHYPIDKVEHLAVFQPANKKQKSVLKLSTSSLVAFLESYFYVDNKIVALGMYFIPHNLLANNQVGLEDAEEISIFFNQYLEQPNLSAITELQVVGARKSTASKMNIKEKDLILMVEETICLNNEPIMLDKIYFLPDYFRFSLRRKNDRF